MSNSVYIGGGKGGTTKTSTSHLLCLGATLLKEPSAYILTDPERDLLEEGRPYSVFDGRKPNDLAKLLASMDAQRNGWWIFDGGGNRPAFDEAMADIVDLFILPFKDSAEDVRALRKDMRAYPKALAWPCAWPTNEKAKHTSQKFIDELSAEFPLRVMAPPLYFVNSIKELVNTVLGDPSTPTRSAARRAFDIMTDTYAAHVEQAPAELAQATA